MICELDGSTENLMLFCNYLCGVCHYLFCAEFLNTYFAMKKMIQILEIATSTYAAKRKNSYVPFGKDHEIKEEQHGNSLEELQA